MNLHVVVNQSSKRSSSSREEHSRRFEMAASAKLGASGAKYGGSSDVMSSLSFPSPPPPPPQPLQSNVIRINICDDDDDDTATRGGVIERKPSQLNREAKLKKQENLLSWKKKEKEGIMVISPAGGAVNNSNNNNVARQLMRTFRPFTDYMPSSSNTREQVETTTSGATVAKETVMLEAATVDFSKDYTSSSASTSSSSSWEDELKPNQTTTTTTTTTTIATSTFKHASSYNNSSLDEEMGSSNKLSSSNNNSNNSNNTASVLVVPLDLKKSGGKRAGVDELPKRNNNLQVIPQTTGSSSLGPSLSFDSVDENKENGVVYSSTELNIDSQRSSKDQEAPLPPPRASAYSTVGVSSGEGGPQQQLDLSIFDLLDKNSKKFVLRPAPLGLTIRCQIYRQKGLYPKYRFYLENVDSNLLLLMTARKKKKTKTSCYVISTLTYDLENVEKYIETPVAKLKSNLLGTHFSLYDFGVKPPPPPPQQPIAQHTTTSSMSVTKKLSRSASFFRASFAGSSTNLAASSTNLKVTRSYNNSSEVSMDLTNGLDDLLTHHNTTTSSSSHFHSSIDQDLCRKQYLSIFYELNMLGFKGPRQMSIIVPGMDNSYNREDFLLRTPHDSLDDAWKQIETSLRQPRSSITSNETTSRKNSTNSSPPTNNNSKHVPVIIKKANSIDTPNNEPINNNLLSIGSSRKTQSRSRLHSIKRSLFHLGGQQQSPASQSSDGKSTSNHDLLLLPRQVSTGSNLEVNNSSSGTVVGGSSSSTTTSSQITNTTTTTTSPTESSCSSGHLTTTTVSSTTSSRNNNKQLPNVVKLINKPPDWHPELRSFALDFNGRVTVSSSKNFQIVHEANTGYVVMQFGKVNRDLFTCDYSYPFCALQAFGIALTSLEDKLGCD